MAASKSEKRTLLNYIIQPFTRQFFDAIYPVQLLAANNGHVFFCI
jgi:hypothetical protein